MASKTLPDPIETAKTLKARWYPWIQNLALDMGLVPGQDDYTRFIILGRSRTGSNFLRGLLNSHSRVVVFGEVFGNCASIGWHYPGFRQSKRALALYQRDPVRFLETRLFRRFPEHVEAVGFKLFYYHAQEEGLRSIWSHLRNQQQVRILHVKRRNVLRTHLSRKRAALSGTWVNLSGNGQDEEPIELDYEECLQDFVRTRGCETRFDAFFRTHETLDIVYEKLARDYHGGMRKVQEFLGICFELLEPTTYKQAVQPLSQAISNYSELKERFSDTVWTEFFEE